MDLRESDAQPVESYTPEIKDWLIALVSGGPEAVDLDDWYVMHHLSRLMISEIPHLSLHHHLCQQVGAPELKFPTGRISIESCELELRHHTMQLIGYLMLDLKGRLGDAWCSRAIRYNHMLKDFRNAPASYKRVASLFMNWRDRL
jgi:hypothetical protein